MRAITLGPLPVWPLVSYTLFLPFSGHPSSCPFVTPALAMSALCEIDFTLEECPYNMDIYSVMYSVFCQRGPWAPSAQYQPQY